MMKATKKNYKAQWEHISRRQPTLGAPGKISLTKWVEAEI